MIKHYKSDNFDIFVYLTSNCISYDVKTVHKDRICLRSKLIAQLYSWILQIDFVIQRIVLPNQMNF